MAQPSTTTSFNAGEIAPQLWGNVDFAKMHVGAATMRNMAVSYKGGAFSRAGTAFVGYSKQSILGIASGSIFWSDNPNPGDTVTLNGVVFTFVASSPGPNEVLIGATTAITIAANFLEDVLNVSVNPAIIVATYDTTGGPSTITLHITYKTAGTAGNSYTLAATGFGTPSGATLTGGVASYPPRLITFQFSLDQGLVLEFGDQYMRVISNGAYVTETPVNISGATQSSACRIAVSSTAGWATGDWGYIKDIVGMTQLNGRIFVVSVVDGTHFALFDIFGNAINSTHYGAYVSGGTIGRVYTLTTPYAAVDLKFLKFTQSADVMSLCLRNQETGTEYAPYELARFADDNWTLTALDTGASISPPNNMTATAANTTVTNPTTYSAVATVVDRDTGEESIASNIGTADDSVDIASTAGAITYQWDPVVGADYYLVYQAPPAVYGTVVPVGSLFGFLGITFSNSFVNSNILPDYSRVPPLHKDPFAPGAIIACDLSSGGSGMTSCTATINTSTGSGATLSVLIEAGSAVQVIVQTQGSGYAQSDTVTFTPDMGVAPTGVLEVGPESGTYPSVVTYFQQRRIYANSANQPDTYWMSQPGSFSNFDTRVPPLDTDAITGTPWSVQVNGIQFMLPLLGGLIALTGQTAYLVGGSGSSPSSPQPITPSSQQALPQVYNGCHFHVAPVTIDYDIYYLQAKGSVIRSLSYNFWVGVLTGVDVTILSSHLFTGYQINSMAWCEEPYRVMWAPRDDGVMLSLTSMKAQDVSGWARHDTQGLFLNGTSVAEPPVDALYVVTQRFLPGNVPVYMIERMDDRIWPTVESAWCVDCALELPQTFPAAGLTFTGDPNGLGTPISVVVDDGGSGYSPGTTAAVNDPTGTGCTLGLTIAGGVITAITPTGGTRYTQPVITITDPNNSGSGATAHVVLRNTISIAADASVFPVGCEGRVIRAGGGVMQITARVNGLGVTAAVVSPITRVIPGMSQAYPVVSGDWSMTIPVTTVYGLDHLDGLTVTGLADGNVIAPQEVSGGTITLDDPASAIIVGLPFTAQMQSLYLEGGQPTIQGRRKKVGGVTYRLDTSGPFDVGVCQPDGSTLSPMQIAPRWPGMEEQPLELPDVVQRAYGDAEIENTTYVRPLPLYTGDVRHVFNSGYSKPGQAAAQQSDPLPLSILAIMRETEIGDTPETQKGQQQPRAA